MKALMRTLLPVIMLFCLHVNGQGKKERIFICKSNLYEDEHTSDPKFNNLVDSACIKINQRKYNDGLRLLNEAFILDSSSTGIANEYFRGQRNKLMKFIAEEEAAKSEQAGSETTDAAPEPIAGGGNSEAPPAEVKVEEKAVADNSTTPEKKDQVSEAPPEKEPSKPAEAELKKDNAEEVPAVSPVPEEPKTTPVSEPEPIAKPVPVEPVVATPPAPVNMEENNAPSELKSFTEEEKEEFHIKGEQKVKSLEGYIKQLTNKNTSQAVVDDVTESAVALFDNEDRTVEVSSLNNPNKVRLKVRKYFQKLSMIPYDNITIEWADFQYTSDFRLGVDGNYYGYIIFRQRFTAEQDQIIIYEDLTTKKIEVILKRYNKNIEGQAVANWDVFLGDISVEQTEKY